MLEMLGKVSGLPGSDKRRPLVLAACDCARLALPCVPKGETRLLAALEAAERWARGEGVTREAVGIEPGMPAGEAFQEGSRTSADVLQKSGIIDGTGD